MEKFVVDSHALFWFLTENPKLSRKAYNAITTTSEVVVPSICLMEILYILQKNKLTSRFVDLLSDLKLRRYVVYPLDAQVVTQSLFVHPELEMHDRIIVATSQLVQAPIISKDSEIQKRYPNTIW